MPRTILTPTPLPDRTLPATGVLFFGNSYTDNLRPDTRVADLVAEIATAADRPPVVTGQRAVGGDTLAGHAAAVNPAAVRALLPTGQPADVVVLQGQSLEAAAGVVGPGGVGEFVGGAVALAADVRAAFPNARFVLYETPARPGTSTDFYPPYYPAPGAMQQDIRAGYDRAAAELQGRYGPAAAEVAPAGAAFAELGFGRHLYLDEGGHPSARGALAVALTVYAAAFDDNVSDIPAARAAGLLAARGLVAADWVWVTRAADRAVGLANVARNERFVRQLYLDALGRPADPGGLDYFLSGLTNGTLSRREVAERFATCPEFYDRQVRERYRLDLGRPADPAGLRYFTGQLQSGQGLDWLRARFAGSDEYEARAGRTPAGLVRQLYRDVLGREADADGLSYWAGRLAAGMSRFDLATAFIDSPEGRERQVRGLYTDLLRRPADADGLRFFVTALQHGLRSQDAVALFLESGEYYDRLA